MGERKAKDLWAAHRIKLRAAAEDDFFYCHHDVELGGVAAVIYEDRVEYAVLGDEGPVTAEPEGADGECEGLPEAGGILGEGSYALADRLGINPNPNRGGVDCEGGDCPVTWIVFQGPGPEDAGDVRDTRRIGRERAWELVK